MTRRHFALTLPGKPRNQEANRKRLVAELERTEKACLYKAEQLAKARAVLVACDVETIAQNKKATRATLTTLVQIGDRWIRVHIGRLLGVETYPLEDEELRMALLDRLGGLELVDSSEHRGEPAQLAPGATVVSPFSVSAALDEAVRIVDDAIEIDWTKNPSCDRERDLRLEIIRNIERERVDNEKAADKYGWNKNGQSHLAFNTYISLKGLCGYTAQEMGSDIFEAVERWRVRFSKEQEHNRDCNARALVTKARHSLNGG